MPIFWTFFLLWRVFHFYYGSFRNQIVNPPFTFISQGRQYICNTINGTFSWAIGVISVYDFTCSFVWLVFFLFFFFLLAKRFNKEQRTSFGMLKRLHKNIQAFSYLHSRTRETSKQKAPRIQLVLMPHFVYIGRVSLFYSYKELKSAKKISFEWKLKMFFSVFFNFYSNLTFIDVKTSLRSTHDKTKWILMK